MTVIKKPEAGTKGWFAPKDRIHPVQCTVEGALYDNAKLVKYLIDEEGREWTTYRDIHDNYDSAYREARRELNIHISRAHKKHKRLIAERKELEQHKRDREN